MTSGHRSSDERRGTEYDVARIRFRLWSGIGSYVAFALGGAVAWSAVGGTAAELYGWWISPGLLTVPIGCVFGANWLQIRARSGNTFSVVLLGMLRGVVVYTLAVVLAAFLVGGVGFWETGNLLVTNAVGMSIVEGVIVWVWLGCRPLPSR